MFSHYSHGILGPDILTMVVGSDISRYPNTPRPTCRGYLHKRTQSAILKGWRKRWFVLKHNGYLHYYKHKKVRKEAGEEESCILNCEVQQYCTQFYRSLSWLEVFME